MLDEICFYWWREWNSKRKSSQKKLLFLNNKNSNEWFSLCCCYGTFYNASLLLQTIENTKMCETERGRRKKERQDSFIDQMVFEINHRNYQHKRIRTISAYNLQHQCNENKYFRIIIAIIPTMKLVLFQTHWVRAECESWESNKISVSSKLYAAKNMSSQATEYCSNQWILVAKMVQEIRKKTPSKHRFNHASIQ